MAALLSVELGLKYVELHDGWEISGILRRRVDLTSGAFLIVQTERSVALTPWQSWLGQRIGKAVYCVATHGELSWRHWKQVSRNA